MKVKVIGGGLAGSEAAWQLAKRGVEVELYEMRPIKQTPAHISSHLAELVCSNSFRSNSITNAVGLLHQELRSLDSIIINAADQASVPAGGALAVDRVEFSKIVENSLNSLPNVTIIRDEISDIEDNIPTIIATGPLTSDKLAKNIARISGSSEDLAFFDAIAPIVHADSINMEKAWMQSRYDKNGKDYINCPMSREEYYAFIDALIESDQTEFKDWEKNTPYFEGCLPIEVMAKRGKETLRFGPMKPVGLNNPHEEDKQPFAVVQLRQDNKAATLYNIVGFQTKIKYSQQVQIFQQIPGLDNAKFARLGGIHRNTFINSPKLLNNDLSLKNHPNIRFAGQITGVEGYVESTAIGLLAGIFCHQKLSNSEILPPYEYTALGSLLNHITHGANADTFQPMNINYGLFPPLDKSIHKKDKKSEYARLSEKNIEAWKTHI